MAARVFEASYTTMCRLCARKIEPGDAAVYVDDDAEPVYALPEGPPPLIESIGAVHEGCAYEAGFEVTHE